MNDRSHQALSVVQQGSKTMVEGVSSHGHAYLIDIEDDDKHPGIAEKWFKALRGNRVGRGAFNRKKAQEHGAD